MSIRIPSPALSSAAKLSSLLWIAFTCGCMDANIHFDAGTQGKISVQENTRASAWHATARVGIQVWVSAINLPVRMANYLALIKSQEMYFQNGT